MYSRREKISHYNTLRGGNHADADFRLLAKKSPSHPILTRAARNPKRYEDDILYALLDVCDAEEILKARQAKNKDPEGSSKTLTKAPCSSKASSKGKGSSKASSKGKGSSKASSKGKGSSKASNKTEDPANTDEQNTKELDVTNNGSSKTLSNETNNTDISQTSDDGANGDAPDGQSSGGDSTDDAKKK